MTKNEEIINQILKDNEINMLKVENIDSELYVKFLFSTTDQFSIKQIIDLTSLLDKQSIQYELQNDMSLKIKS